MSEPEYAQINHGWRITHNPEGGGLMLCIDRGISCEGHTQVVSSHTTNTPEIATVQAVVDETKATLDGQIDAFVEFMRSLGSDWTLKQHIALLFAHHIVKTVADAAEGREFA